MAEKAEAARENPSRWWHRQRHEDRRPMLVQRGRIKQAIRTWFVEHGFIEVETAALQVSPGNETHLHAFATEYVPLGGPLDGQPARALYLATSPEFACKKLLAAGEQKIFTFAPAYRNRERGRLHHPEFTMLEWYRTECDYHTLMADCADLLRLTAAAAEIDVFGQGDVVVDAAAAPEEIAVGDAFERFAGIDLAATYTPRQTHRDALAALAQQAGVRVAADDTWSDIFTRVLVEKVEPELGRTAPSILMDYPIHEAALAAPGRLDPMTAERFELYLAGIELVNAFTELADPAEQRRRFEADMAEKERIYGVRYPIDEDFLAALAFMPAATGAALGFDRLVMLATGATRIDDVIWTPIDLG